MWLLALTLALALTLTLTLTPILTLTLTLAGSECAVCGAVGPSARCSRGAGCRCCNGGVCGLQWWSVWPAGNGGVCGLQIGILLQCPWCCAVCNCVVGAMVQSLALTLTLILNRVAGAMVQGHLDPAMCARCAIPWQVCDRGYARICRQWRATVAEKCPCRMVQVHAIAGEASERLCCGAVRHLLGSRG